MECVSELVAESRILGQGANKGLISADEGVIDKTLWLAFLAELEAKHS